MEGENSDSTNTSGTSTPAVQEAPGMSASAKRFDYLLKQTELFSHFMGNKSNSPQKVCYTLSLVVKFLKDMALSSFILGSRPTE